MLVILLVHIVITENLSWSNFNRNRIMCWIKPILFILLQMISLVVLLTAANLCEFWRASLRTSLPLVWVEMQSKYVQLYKNYYVKLYKLELPSQRYTSAIEFARYSKRQFVITYLDDPLDLQTTDWTLLMAVDCFKIVFEVQPTWLSSAELRQNTRIANGYGKPWMWNSETKS